MPDPESPQPVLSGLLGSAPTPAHPLESESGPEQVGGEVDGTPELDAGATASGSFFNDPIHEGTTVDEEPSVATNVHNKTTHDATVATPEDVADEVGVVVAGDQAALVVSSDVGSGREPTDAHAVDFVRARGEREDFKLAASVQIECGGDFDAWCWMSPEGL